MSDFEQLVRPYKGSDKPGEFCAWLASSLSLVRDYLQMETGIASYIVDNNYSIVAVDSAMDGVFSAGMEYPLESTYCAAVFSRQETVTYDHVGEIESMLQHPVYLAVKLESYIASPVKSNTGKVIGTINFTSLDPHAGPFSDEHKALVEYLAEAVSEHLELYTRCFKDIPPH